jgi:hypothetical protein
MTPSAKIDIVKLYIKGIKMLIFSINIMCHLKFLAHIALMPLGVTGIAQWPLLVRLSNNLSLNLSSGWGQGSHLLV